MEKRTNWGIIIFFIVGTLLLAFIAFDSHPELLKYFSSSSILDHAGIYTPPPQANLGQEISLQEVKNLGVDFYVGQIESPNTNDITDDIKNQITKIVYNAHFPQSILKNLPIIILNNLALTGNQYIQVSGTNLKIPNLTPDFLSEGGFYATYEHGGTVIFINKSTVTQNQLTDVLTHELGHAIGAKLTDADWKKFYQLRNIPTATVRHGTNWNLSPEEDFAEVYKNTYTGIAARTYYGFLSPVNGIVMGRSFEEKCGDIYNQIYDAKISAYEKSNPPKDCSKETGFEQMQCTYFGSSPYTTDAQKTTAENSANASANVQSCRRGVMANSSSWSYGMAPYTTSVSKATKDFITSIINRLTKNN